MRQTTRILTLLFFILTISSYGQVDKKKNYFPIWSFHKDSINIHGISVGLWSFNSEPRHTNTNGIKIELIGVGLGIPLIPRSPIVKTDSLFIKLKKEPLSERINGLNLSASGSVCHCLTNGLTAGYIGQIHFQVNGISTSLFMNFTQKHNGVMAAFFNDAYYMNGLQVGFINNGYKTKGLQIGMFGNNTSEMKGLQIGLYNKSKKLKGLQIGLWNVNQKRKFPIINWNFKRETE
ncbi:hypothetical protein M0M57_07595 [Flavobacterium azooxidireducens]|uniref:Uncharacterized protein n=1 Tax=Flavobacterium azooxidireducens TaxID=1871076 RepID=A0ABY4KIN2_9FLAO|nr:hypothetical protein [Flavobacterium azooxidireducens]UPQ80694.1 hypothetical protein M0M57_07595 [Flavobacterium azooxidireducens]